MSEYRRSLDELREIYLQDCLPGELDSESQMFDEAIRAVRADAWDEGMQAIESNAWIDWVTAEAPTNPYREDDT